MSRQSIPVDGYPAPGADAIKEVWRGDHWGPGNNANTGNYLTGGYNLNASALGMAGIEVAAVSALSQSGNYFARIIYPANFSANTEVRAPTYSYVKVLWYVASNSNEVGNNTDLSAEVVRLSAIGI